MARDPRAYLELHIEQGPVLESMDRPAGVVIGTYGVERHALRFTGQAAHSGSTPMAMRRDAFLAAAEAALAFREIARRWLFGRRKPEWSALSEPWRRAGYCHRGAGSV